MDTVTAFLNDPAGLALKALLVAAFLDFVTGTFAAVRDGSFEWMAIAAWLRKHLAGRVGPMAALLLVLYWSGDGVMLATTIAAATAYSAETIRSIVDNVGTIARPEPEPDEVVVEGTLVSTLNPVPND